MLPRSGSIWVRLTVVVALIALGTGFALASEEGGGGHADPLSIILLDLALLIVVAFFARWAAGKLQMPGVLGELLVGIIVGNILFQAGQPLFVVIMELDKLGPLMFDVLTNPNITEAQAIEMEFGTDPAGQRVMEALTGPNGASVLIGAIGLWIFSYLGVILLLVMVGLESSVDEMLGVGPNALGVAILGIVLPSAFGVGASMLLLRDAPMVTHLFLGATLCATSVGITARVFKDIGKIRSREAKVILGAAVIDDVLGLVVLAVVIGIATTGSIDPVAIGKIVAYSALFLVAVVLIGERVMKRLSVPLSKVDDGTLRLLVPLSLGFGLAWVAGEIGLAAIVGAFAAGLILKDEFFPTKNGENGKIEHYVAPLESLFAPVFFVLMGMQVNLEALLQREALLLAAAFTVLAIVGKLGAGVLAGKGVNRFAVGIGMVPRGEVGLIFASIGKTVQVNGEPLMSDAAFSAVVLMVVVTTLITPIGLKATLGKETAPEPSN